MLLCVCAGALLPAAAAHGNTTSRAAASREARVFKRCVAASPAWAVWDQYRCGATRGQSMKKRCKRLSSRIARRRCVKQRSAFLKAHPKPLSFLQGAPSRYFGVSEPDYRAAGIGSPQQLDQMAAPLGANSVRFQVTWAQAEPAPPAAGVHAYNFSAYDDLYKTQVDSGMKPLIVLSASPRWAWANPAAPWAIRAPGPNHLDDFNAFCHTVADRYPKAAGIEVWNEPNWDRFWGGTPSASAYADLLKSCYAGVKSARPSLPVIGGALAPAAGADPATGPEPFAASVLQALGGQPAMDGISVHLYPAYPHTPMDAQLFGHPDRQFGCGWRPLPGAAAGAER